MIAVVPIDLEKPTFLTDERFKTEAVHALAINDLIQAPFLFLPNFIDWIFGNKPREPSD